MLTIKRELEIKKIAENILKKHNIKNMPVNLKEILKKEGISYYEKDLIKANLPTLAEAEAVFYIDESNNKTIILNSGIAEKYSNRKNFTVAHELGHLYLHTKNNEPYIATRRQNNDIFNHEEEEANKFAAHLLMPDNIVEEIFFTKNNLTLESLANFFGVSIRAMEKKLLELGLVTHE